MTRPGKELTHVGYGTKSVWGGEAENEYHATMTPVVHAVTYGYHDMNEWFNVAVGKQKGYIYSRNTNPTVSVFEEKVRVLEGGEAATSFSTGMAAISNTLFALLKPGDHVVTIKDTYGGTSRLFIEFLPRINVKVTLCDTSNQEQILEDINAGCNVLYIESPTNPTLKILDIKLLAAAAKKVGAIVIVDNTFASPINQNPLKLGADLVVHSATKFLGGHSDVMGGVVCGSKTLVDQVYAFREINGASLHPQAAYFLIRGMKTLELRVQRQNTNAMKLAEFLQKNEEVDEVFYPGLATHLRHEVAAKQMRGFGGVLSFSLKGDFERVKTFLTNLSFVHLAASLGSVSSLAGPPKVTSHVELTEAERAELGIPENLIRFSVGIENIEDLIDDMTQAFSKLH